MILKDLSIGTIVIDKKTKFNGKPIEWIVTDHEKYQDGTVLFSKDIICCKPFDDSKELGYKEYKEHSICWENSSIRNWLKTDFFYKSFSRQLRCMSFPVEISECDRNNATRKTKDNIFLLSASEVIGYRYTDNHEVLQLFKDIDTNKYITIDRNKYITSEACRGLKWSWWLRSPMVKNSHYIYFVDEHGLLGNANAHYVSMGVRPACVISDYTPIKEKKNGDYKFDWSPLHTNWRKQFALYSIMYKNYLDFFSTKGV